MKVLKSDYDYVMANVQKLSDGMGWTFTFGDGYKSSIRAAQKKDVKSLKEPFVRSILKCAYSTNHFLVKR